jgi:hypothetical protein
MLKRHKSSGSRPKLTRRPKRKPAGPMIGGGLFAGYEIHSDGFVIEDDDADDPIIVVRGGTRHDSGSDASGAGEDAVPNDGDDQASAGDVRSPTGRLALRSSRKVDRLRSEGRKIDLDEENDVLRRIRDVGNRCREPMRFYLGVLVFPKEADGWVRVVADHMAPSTNVSTGTPRQKPPSPPVAQRGLKPWKRLRPRARDE